MSVWEVAKLCRFKVQRVEELESGLETWLSAADRQIIAKALAVEPALLKEVETRSGLADFDEIGSKEKLLRQEILLGKTKLACPQCGGRLVCTVENALDIEDRPFRFAKAFCNECTFILR